MKNYVWLLFSPAFFLAMQSNAQITKPQIGITSSYKSDSLLYAQGFTYIEESVTRILSPDMPEDTFQLQLQQIRKMHCKLENCNSFFPSSMKLVGPAVNEEQVLSYVDKIMKRAKTVGIKIIVLGSGPARHIPEDTNRDSARTQFINLCRKMAIVASHYDVTIAIENLNSTETNFVNTLSDANNIVNTVNHPNFKLTADIYHMLKEHEPASNIEKTGKNLVHCHLAEREKRTAPGIAGDDFKPYLSALHHINYKGRISLECRWDNIATEAKPALKYLNNQLLATY